MSGTAKYPALMIPDLAVGTDQGQKFVYVVNDKDVVEYKNVKLGPLIDGMRVYPQRMLRNLESTLGLIFSGQLLLDLSAAGMLSCSVSKADCHITTLATVATVGRPDTIILSQVSPEDFGTYSIRNSRHRVARPSVSAPHIGTFRGPSPRTI